MKIASGVSGEINPQMPALDHVALLVAHLDPARGEAQVFPGEGTRELYVGQLLLIEAIAPGPYQRALERRGPGLHHVAIAVDQLEPYIASLAGTGWYLLPQSLATIAQSRTAWLARPGACLIEVMEGPPRPGTITRVEIPGPPDLFERLQVPGLERSEAGTWLTIDGTRYEASQCSS